MPLALWALPADYVAARDVGGLAFRSLEVVGGLAFRSLEAFRCDAFRDLRTVTNLQMSATLSVQLIASFLSV